MTSQGHLLVSYVTRVLQTARIGSADSVLHDDLSYPSSQVANQKRDLLYPTTKSLTSYATISWYVSSKVVSPYDELKRGKHFRQH